MRYDSVLRYRGEPAEWPKEGAREHATAVSAYGKAQPAENESRIWRIQQERNQVIVIKSTYNNEKEREE